MSKGYRWNNLQLQKKNRLCGRLALLFMALALVAYWVTPQYDESLAVTSTLLGLGLGVIFMLVSTKAKVDDRKLEKGKG